MGRMTAWAVVLAIGCGAGAFMTACGGGGGGGGGGEPSVAVFADTGYVEYNVDSNGAEASNVVKTLEHLGIEAVAFTGITAEAFGSALAGRTVLAFPEIIPTHYLVPDLSPEAVAVIRDFVEGGGTLLLFSGEAINAAIAETAFGWDITMGTEVTQGTIDIMPVQAAGTAFEGGPATLSLPSQVTSNGNQGYPPGAVVMYEESEWGTSCVTVTPAGSGQVIHLGWDWDWIEWQAPATPISQGDDGGWFEVLDRAVRY